MVIDRKRAAIVFAGPSRLSSTFTILQILVGVEGCNIDITGLLMVLTLKVTACALNYQDSGTIAESERNDFQRRRAVETPARRGRACGWSCLCTLVVGPAIEFRDYHDWLHKKGVGREGLSERVGQVRAARRLLAGVRRVHMIVMQYYTLGNT